MRRRARGTVLLLLASLTVACSGGGDFESVRPDEDPGASTSVPSATTTTEPPLTGYPLQVVDQGVSSFPDPFDPASTIGGYGVVLENLNPYVMATGVHVVTRILDDAGNELLVDSTLLNGIMPKQRMAVGRTLIEPLLTAPTRLEITVEVSAWLLPADEGTLIAEGVVTEPEVGGGSVTRFAVRSTWPDQEEGVDVTALYRAADGRILAAEFTSLTVPVGEPAAGRIPLLAPIPDLAATEVLVGRGFAALTGG